MVKGNSNNLLVNKIPGKTEVKPQPRDGQEKEESDFKEILTDQIKELKISVHAAKRLKERNLEMDPVEYLKLREAVTELRKKGGNDSLVITGKAAYIIDVKNQTVVTALDKEKIENNIFTKIDSTVVIN